MKKKFLLVAAATFSLGSVMAQTTPVLPEGMEILTPDGVTVTTTTDRSFDKAKNIIIAGSPEKGYKAFFTATDADHGEELWVSDGTKGGTKMVKDIFPKETTSNPSYLTRFNDKVVFSAESIDPEGIETGSQLWISDGTEEGTKMLKQINILGPADPRGIIQLNETHFVFAAKDFESETYKEEAQWWLWISDGTEDGTQLLKDCNVKYPGGKVASDEYHFVRVGRKVFFKADSKDGEFGEELWVTDGTPNGTFMVKDINTAIADEATGATGNAQLDMLTNFKNEKLFFEAYSEEYGREPWVSDGTANGTYMIKDLTPGSDDAGIPKGHGAFTPRVYGDHVYFRGFHENYGTELFRTDFTEEGTYMVADLNRNPVAAGTANGSPDLFCEFDGVLFMKASTGGDASVLDPVNYGLELFYTDGTEEGTKMHSDMAPGVTPNAAWEGIVISGSFYFRAQNRPPGGPQLWELFRLDSKDEAMPQQIMDLGEGPDFVHTLRNLNGDVVFTSQIIPRLFRYHYRKADYDPTKDTESMEPDFGDPQTKVTAPSVETLVLYPNPARNIVSIQTEKSIHACTVTDLTGRIVLQQNGGQKTISVSDLAKGTYILSVTTDEGKMDSKLIIE